MAAIRAFVKELNQRGNQLLVERLGIVSASPRWTRGTRVPADILQQDAALIEVLVSQAQDCDGFLRRVHLLFRHCSNSSPLTSPPNSSWQCRQNEQYFLLHRFELRFGAYRPDRMPS